MRMAMAMDMAMAARNESRIDIQSLVVIGATMGGFAFPAAAGEWT